MKRLEALENGSLTGLSTFKLSSALTTFPQSLFKLADTLEVLDLSGNQLHTLPEDFGRFKKLRILFLSENNFTVFPEVLAECPNLSMIGFKSNEISKIPEHAFPKDLRWLILTDNRIEKLPDSMGALTKLQKCMLAGNRLSRLPESMQQCRSLELLRISANHLETLPDWLFALPKLSWLACAGNPFVNTHLREEVELSKTDWRSITLHEELGKGASGIISKASLFEKEEAFAVKLFKGEVTSDGYPVDEMQACIMAGEHKNLTQLHSKIDAHPEAKEGLVLSLIPPSYTNMGNPPSLESCTRDTYAQGLTFPLEDIIAIAKDIASAAAHLHQRNIMHGDLYAHNILLNNEAHPLFGDFGAATIYSHIDGIDNNAFERMEVRAFGCLLEDMMERFSVDNPEEKEKSFSVLKELQEKCMDEYVTERPLFAEIVSELSKLD